MDHVRYAAGDSGTEIFVLAWVLLIDSLSYVGVCIICNVLDFLLGIKACGFIC